MERGAGDAAPDLCPGEVPSRLDRASPDPESGELREAGENPNNGSVLEVTGSVAGLEGDNSGSGRPATGRPATEAAGLTKAHNPLGSGVTAGEVDWEGNLRALSPLRTG